MLSSQDRLCLGLWALDYVETASKGPWRRFAKFGRARMEGAAYYVLTERCYPLTATGSKIGEPDDLWHSPIRFTEPRDFVGSPTSDSPIFEQFWQAGWKAHLLSQPEAGGQAMAQSKIDADKALDELIGGSK